MKRLTGYILKEQLYPFLTGFIFFTFILMLNKLFILADLIVNRSVESSQVIKLFLLMLPVTISLTIPMSVLISVIMALGRLSADFEIVALRAGGISTYRIMKPVVISGLFIFIMMIIFNETIVVYSNRNYNKMFIKILNSTPTAILEEGIFTTMGDKTIWVERIDQKSGRLDNIMLYNKNNGGGWDVIKAKGGIWKQNSDGSKTLRLQEGRLFSSEFERGSYSVIDFIKGKADILLSESKIDYNEEGRLNPKEMTSIELYRMLKSIAKSYKEDRDVALYWVEFFKKHAIPFSCVVFAVIGIPFGIISRRSGSGIGFGISIIIFFLYYIFFMSGQFLAVKGMISPSIGVWISNIMLLLIGIILILYRERFGV